MAMRDKWYSASVGLGRWGGVSLRLHWLLVLFLAATICLVPTTPVVQVAGQMPQYVMLAIGLLLLSILIHELGHYVVARTHGLAPETLVLGPLTGLSPWRFSGSARYDLWWALGGPAANLLVAAAGLLVLFLVEGSVSWAALLHPLRPAWSVQPESLGGQALRMGIWLNWLLCLVNLLPGYPFDGSRAVRGLTRCWWRHAQRQHVAEITFWIALVVAMLMLNAAVLVGRYESDIPFPGWLALVLLAVMVLISAARDLEHRLRPSRGEAAGGPPAVTTGGSPAATVLSATAATGGVAPTRGVGPVSTAAEADGEQEDDQLDELLRRVHVAGLDGLTERERAALLRASERLRERRGRRG